LPKFALKNKLYRGVLPAQFHDITWVEELVCSPYCSTAHVTRLYHIDDPNNPHVFHGNTCAHSQNVLSTALILPCTPSDVNDSLSVIFTGSSTKVLPKCLKQVFHIRKEKVRLFLHWLIENNHIFHALNVRFSSTALDMYDDDGSLPGVDEHVIFNQ
ncbi:hypothetical protein BS47DRAFT_1258795, partial [Hydnum rufescens UP504]